MEIIKKKKTTYEDVIQVAKNKGMTPTEFIEMLIDNHKQLGLSKKILNELKAQAHKPQE